MIDKELLEAAARYRELSGGKEPSLVWYAENGDENAKHFIDFIGFTVMAVVIWGVIGIIRALTGRM